MSRQRTMEKIVSSEYVSIGELARLTGFQYSTLKFYTEEGMLPFEQAEENLTRRFPRVPYGGSSRFERCVARGNRSRRSSEFWVQFENRSIQCAQKNIFEL